jgi:nucleoside diphosphate kinase
MTKEQFTDNLHFWNSYLPLLYLALENTSGDVIELGMGDGSTEKLHFYCKENARRLYSYETDKEWFRKFEQFRTERHDVEWVGHNWQIMIERHREKIGVLFSDEAPGEMRKYNISMFCNLAQVIVVHDSEQSSDHGYKLSLVAPLFKYRKDFDYPGASATAFSNFIDVSKWSIQDNTQPAAIMSS